MPQGDKSSYTGKQKRKARHIEESYVDRGVSQDEAEAHAWATVNKQDEGGKKRGPDRAQASTHKASKRRDDAPIADRSAAAKKAARTRARNAQASS